MARDHHPGRDAAAPSEAERPRPADQPCRAPLSDDPAVALRPLRCPLYSRPRSDRKRRYVCASGPTTGGCGKITIVAEPLEQFLVEAVLHRLESPQLPKAMSRATEDNSGAQWQGEIEQAQAQLDDLAALWADRTITRGEWLKARPPIEKRHDTREEEARRVEPDDGAVAVRRRRDPRSREVGDDDLVSPGADRRRRRRPRRRQPHIAAWLQPFRLVTAYRRLARLSRTARAARRPPPALRGPRPARKPLRQGGLLRPPLRFQTKLVTEPRHTSTLPARASPPARDDRHTRDGLLPIRSEASAITASSDAAASGTFSGWKPCATSYRCKPGTADQ